MKWDQIDMALSALSQDSGDTIVIQHEFMSDRKLITHHIRLVLGDPDVVTSNTMSYIGLGRIVFAPADDDRHIHGYPDNMIFFIERRNDNYMDGDMIGVNSRIDSIMRAGKSATSVVSVRRNEI